MRTNKVVSAEKLTRIEIYGRVGTAIRYIQQLLGHSSGRTGIGSSTLCVAYAQDKVGIMTFVNDNLSHDNISILSDNIKVATME
ncbi:hypothetical protein ACVWYG_002024 [Pedobacter sp. UYEF25]